MPDTSIDAIKIARAIQDDDLSILREKEFKMRDKIKKRKRMKKKKTKHKYTLNQLGSKIDQIGDALFEFIKTTNERFNRIETRLDYNGLKKLPERK